jgi:hypothetical protein
MGAWHVTRMGEVRNETKAHVKELDHSGDVGVDGMMVLKLLNK